MFSYEIDLSQPLFDSAEFQPTSPETFDPSTVTADRILEASFNGVPSGEHSLGTILPAGLSETELSNLIDSARFLGQPLSLIHI